MSVKPEDIEVFDPGVLPVSELPQDASAAFEVGGIVKALPRPKLAKPRKYSTGLAEKAVELRVTGIPLNHIGPLVGVHSRTLKGWIDAGESDPDGPLGPFALAMQQAHAVFIAGLVDEWKRLAVETKQWTALATLAERTDSSNFRRPSDKTEVQVTVGILERRLADAGSASTVYTGG